MSALVSESTRPISSVSPGGLRWAVVNCGTAAIRSALPSGSARARDHVQQVTRRDCHAERGKRLLANIVARRLDPVVLHREELLALVGDALRVLAQPVRDLRRGA